MNKTITLTPDEITVIKDDVESSLAHVDATLLTFPEADVPEEREEHIQLVRTCESILRKLGQ